jgi:hypothetical protein
MLSTRSVASGRTFAVLSAIHWMRHGRVLSRQRQACRHRLRFVWSGGVETWRSGGIGDYNIYIYICIHILHIAYCIILHYIILYYIVVCYIISYHIILYCVMLCYIIIYYIILYYVMLYHIISVFIISYYIILYYIIYVISDGHSPVFSEFCDRSHRGIQRPCLILRWFSMMTCQSRQSPTAARLFCAEVCDSVWLPEETSLQVQRDSKCKNM